MLFFYVNQCRSNEWACDENWITRGRNFFTAVRVSRRSSLLHFIFHLHQYRYGEEKKSVSEYFSTSIYKIFWFINKIIFFFSFFFLLHLLFELRAEFSVFNSLISFSFVCIQGIFILSASSCSDNESNCLKCKMSFWKTMKRKTFFFIFSQWYYFYLFFVYTFFCLSPSHQFHSLSCFNE